MDVKDSISPDVKRLRIIFMILHVYNDRNEVIITPFEAEAARRSAIIEVDWSRSQLSLSI